MILRNDFNTSNMRYRSSMGNTFPSTPQKMVGHSTLALVQKQYARSIKKQVQDCSDQGAYPNDQMKMHPLRHGY